MKKVKMNIADRKIREQSKMKWIMKGSWGKLTSGEKAARVALKVLRYALIAVTVAAIGTVVAGVVLGIAVAIGISGAFIGGFRNASRTNTNRFYGHYDKW